MQRKKTPNQNDPLAQVWVLIKKNRFQAALDLLIPIRNAPKRDYFIAQARCLQGLNRFDEAVTMFKKADPELRNSKAVMGLGRCLQLMGKRQEALKIYEKCQHDPQVLICQARCLEELNNFPGAVATYRNILAKKNVRDINSVLISLGRCLERTSSWEEALKTFTSIRGWENNPDFIVAVARCYQNQKRYADALTTFKLVRNWRQNPNILYGMAIVHEAEGNDKEAFKSYETAMRFNPPPEVIIGQAIFLQRNKLYKEAVALYQSCQDWESNEQCLIGIGRCYQEDNRIEEATATYKRVLGWENNSSVQLGLAVCLEAKGEYLLAAEAYNKLKGLLRDHSAEFGLARSFEAMGKYDDAVNAYKTIPDYSKNPDVMLLLARCYEGMYQFRHAISTYEAIPGLATDVKALITYGYCKEKMGLTKEAIEIFKTVPSYDHNVLALLAIARCYESMGQFDQSLATFKRIPHWEQNQLAQLGIAICLECARRYNEAINQFDALLNQQQDTKTVIARAKCYQKMGNHAQALASIEAIADWQVTKGTLLAYALILEDAGDIVRAKTYLHKCWTLFPNDQETHYIYALFLLRTEDKEALSMIEELKKRWPWNQFGYLLLAQFYERLDPARSLEILTEAKMQFPYNYQIYLNLIRYHLLMGHRSEAQSISNECQERFVGFEKLNDRINQLFNMAPTMLWLSLAGEITTRPVLARVDLTEFVRKVFQALESVPGEHYLVGSEVLNLIELTTNNRAYPAFDVDVVTNCAQASALTAKGFKESPNFPRLFTRRDLERPIELFMPPEHKQSLDRCALDRDYTVSAIFCDNTGYLTDPTGMGVDDFMQRTLRMIGNPELRLQEDPIRVLRAIKYMMHGFKPVANLDTALREWKPQFNLNREHVMDVTRKQFATNDRHKFVEIMLQYGLVQKMFGISEQLPLPTIIAQIQSQIDAFQHSRGKATLFYVLSEPEFPEQGQRVSRQFQ